MPSSDNVTISQKFAKARMALCDNVTPSRKSAKACMASSDNVTASWKIADTCTSLCGIVTTPHKSQKRPPRFQGGRTVTYYFFVKMYCFFATSATIPSFSSYGTRKAPCRAAGGSGCAVPACRQSIRIWPRSGIAALPSGFPRERYSPEASGFPLGSRRLVPV